MAEYFEREAALALVRPDDPNDERCAVTVATAKRLIRHVLSAAPPTDVAPVVHGRWVRHDDGVVTCSECGNAESSDSYYCRYCGAKMDGGDNDAVD